MIPIIFIHGWALGPELWDKVADKQPGACVDLGFKGQPVLPPAGERPIVVGHSMGFAWALKHIPQPWTAAVAVNGFARFTKSADFDHGTDPRILSRMIARLKTHPDAVIADFLDRCAGPQPNTDGYDLAALTQGLQDLADIDVRAEIAQLACPLIAFATRDDAIVSPDLTGASFDASAIEWFDGPSHLLPMTHAEQIAARLQSLAARQ